MLNPAVWTDQPIDAFNRPVEYEPPGALRFACLLIAAVVVRTDLRA